MGLSIHYSGAIKDYRLIDELVAEVKDIAACLEWSQHEFRDEYINGLYIAPDRCEPAFLTFTDDGTLCSPVNFQLLDPDSPGYFVVSVKTQYAGAASHIALLKLLAYLSKKYFSRFELKDEGNYWETFDEASLNEQFSQYDAALAAVQHALRNFTTIPGESSESLAGRLEEWFRKKPGNTE